MSATGEHALTFGKALIGWFFGPLRSSDAVIEETTWAIRQLRLKKLGCETLSLFLQISKLASLSTCTMTSSCDKSMLDE